MVSAGICRNTVIGQSPCWLYFIPNLANMFVCVINCPADTEVIVITSKWHYDNLSCLFLWFVCLFFLFTCQKYYIKMTEPICTEEGRSMSREEPITFSENIRVIYCEFPFLPLKSGVYCLKLVFEDSWVHFVGNNVFEVFLGVICG